VSERVAGGDFWKHSEDVSGYLTATIPNTDHILCPFISALLLRRMRIGILIMLRL
jgi:hypothetical protein